jgi:hypothetical protein
VHAAVQTAKYPKYAKQAPPLIGEGSADVEGGSVALTDSRQILPEPDICFRVFCVFCGWVHPA